MLDPAKRFVVHPDTNLLQKVTFQVTSHEGSVIVSCATSIELGLIQCHRNLDEVPEEGSLIYSIADMLKKQNNKNCPAESIKGSVKPKKDMQSEKPSINSRNKKPLYSGKNCQEDKNSVMQSVTKEENIDVQLSQPAIKSICSDKNCQSTRCYKNISPRRPKCDKKLSLSDLNLKEQLH